MDDTILEERHDGVAKLTLNRPNKLNSLTADMLEALNAKLRKVAEDEDVRAVMLTGAGRAFCAGQDLNDRSVAPGDEPPDLGESLERRYNPLVRRMRRMPKPVVVAVNGVAAGAGANIAFAGDIVLAGRSAKFVQAFSKIGLLPDSGGTYSLPRSLGLPRAMGLAMLGEAVTAEQAADWGLIWAVVDDDTLHADSSALAASLAAGPTAGYAAIKTAMNASLHNTLDEQLDLERDLQRTAGRTADYREGVAAFIEKRPATFTGR